MIVISPLLQVISRVYIFKLHLVENTSNLNVDFNIY